MEQIVKWQVVLISCSFFTYITICLPNCQCFPHCFSMLAIVSCLVCLIHKEKGMYHKGFVKLTCKTTDNITLFKSLKVLKIAGEQEVAQCYI